MRDTLQALLSSKVKAAVLRLLFRDPGTELHVRELARRAGLSEGTVRQELARLGGLGLVTSRRSGNRSYYRAEASHPLFRDLQGLVLKTSGLVDVLRDALRDAPVDVAFVFGSIAAGTEGAGSDIDVMVVGAVSLRQVVQRLAAVTNRLGREVNPHVVTRAELARRVSARDHFLTSVLASPRLFVVGDEHELAAVG